MKSVKDILNKVVVNEIQGNTLIKVNAIVFDSRNVQKNCLFAAQKGLLFDGHQFIDKAIELGAVAILCEKLPENLDENITYIQVEDSNSALALIASNFYENPSSKLKLIGITGTNGKTTVATLLYKLFQNAGYKT
ncbi:MAG: Mur ligase domain-containing protein, partial [Lutibacter sp.]|nr:Mur ligase domain-containing protein [Lutibacter sp.]